MSKQIIDQAIREKKDVVFKYTKYSGETSQRRVSNIAYSNEYGQYGFQNDHIKGYCHKRKEDRTFRISRISSLQLYSGINTTHKSPNPTFKPTERSKTKDGCYIATMVYGDYDHPQVLVLREFRDNKLRKTLFGETFISLYYQISPQLVIMLKGHVRANAIIKRILNKVVKLLKR